MILRLLGAVALTLTASVMGLQAEESKEEPEWTRTFLVEKSELVASGRNPFFILEPGYQLVLAGKEDSEELRLTITVLDETRTVDGVETRVVEERETKGGTIVEISRNFFATSKRTNDVYYFGEEVDIYRGGKVVSHEGAWLSGVGDARFGLARPGSPLLGARYYQELAPGKAMDRPDVVSLSSAMETTAGRFANAHKTEVTTPLEPGARESKYYAAGVGLIKDGPCKLVSHGMPKK